jgi:hypothetical protein
MRFGVLGLMGVIASGYFPLLEVVKHLVNLGFLIKGQIMR